MTTRLSEIVIDCARPAALARFWAAAIDGYALRPYDEEEIARLAAAGIHDLEDDPTVAIDSPDEAAPVLFFQRVPEPKAVKNRVHLDLAATDQAATVARLLSLGATIVAEHRRDDGVGWTVMADPEGNEFCVTES